MNRQDVYKILDSEREYQKKKWSENHESQNSLNDYLSYMEFYLQQCQSNLSVTDTKLDNLRKLTAVGIAAMEKFGGNPRD